MQDPDFIDQRIDEGSEDYIIHKLERTRQLIHGKELAALRKEIDSINETIATQRSENESLKAELESLRSVFEAIRSELLSVRLELQRTVEYEKDFLIQSITERDIKYEQELAGLMNQLSSFQGVIETIQGNIAQMNKAKTDLRTLGIKYSNQANSLTQKQKPKKD